MNTDRVSALIGQHLLKVMKDLERIKSSPLLNKNFYLFIYKITSSPFPKGYAMLADVCKNCNAPLLQSKSKEVNE